METLTSADGTPIAFERTGSGPPLVLVHGMAGNRTRWELFDVRPRLAEHTTVYAMDRRGHGGSGDADEYALEREFEDVAAVVDAIDEPVHLLGHSHGGLCVLEAALRTDNLGGLIVYEPAGPWEEGHLYSKEMYEELEALVEDGENERALLVFLREVVDVPESQIDDLRAAPNWSDRVDEAPTLPREYRVPVSYEFEPERFADMTIPTLLLVGGESPQWARDATEELEDALPNSRISVLEGQGHLAMNTAPELFVDEVLTFVRESPTEEARTVSASGDIQLPVADVFTFYAENHHRNHPRWDPDIEMELETEGPIGVGSVIRRRNTRYEEPVEGTMEVTEFEENEAFGGVIREGGFEMVGRATFEALGPEETKLTLETSVPDSIDPEMIQNGMKRSVQRIKDLAESEYGSSSSST